MDLSVFDFHLLFNNNSGKYPHPHLRGGHIYYPNPRMSKCRIRIIIRIRGFQNFTSGVHHKRVRHFYNSLTRT